MAYKTPEQMVQLIRDEHLLTDACMTIIEGRNEYGFEAKEVPVDSVKQIENNKFEITLFDGEKDVVIPVEVAIQPTSKQCNFWLVNFGEGKYNVVCVQHDTDIEDVSKLKQKEYLSMIAMFCDHYKVGTKMRLLNILKNGYALLKKEVKDENPYELLRDYMDESMVVQRAERMPDKYGVRFNFHFD